MSETVNEIVKIPADRVKVLVGGKENLKGAIEEKCNVRLLVDPEGEVEIEGDATDVFFAKDVVKAVGRGFAPREALKLTDHDYNLFIIALKDIVPSDKAMVRLKGRVIGTGGKIKGEIESATESYISVYGNTIAIIARIDTMEYAKEAVAMLLEGGQHTGVLNYLAKARREIKESRLIPASRHIEP